MNQKYTTTYIHKNKKITDQMSLISQLCLLYINGVQIKLALVSWLPSPPYPPQQHDRGPMGKPLFVLLLFYGIPSDRKFLKQQQLLFI